MQWCKNLASYYSYSIIVGTTDHGAIIILYSPITSTLVAHSSVKPPAEQETLMYQIKLGLGFIISREVLLSTKVVLSTPTSTRCAVAIDS